MEGATRYLIAVLQAQAPAAREAAVTWDPEGAASMFRNPTLYQGDPGNLYVFCYGYIGDEHAPAIKAALAASFPGGVMVAACPFDAALQEAGLSRVPVALPA